MFTFLIRNNLYKLSRNYSSIQEKITQAREKILTSIALAAINVSDLIMYRGALAIYDDTGEINRKKLFKEIEKKSPSIEKIRELLAHPEIDPNKADESGNVPLSCSIFNSNLEALKVLLAHPEIDPNKANKNGKTSLHYAICQNEAEAIKMLLAHPEIDPNNANENGHTLLWWAIYSNKVESEVEAVKMLLAHPEIDPNKADKSGDTLLDWAICQNDPEAVKPLLDHPKIALNLKLINEFIDKKELELESLESDSLSTSDISDIKDTLKVLRKKAEEFYKEGLSSSYIANAYKKNEQMDDVLGVITKLLTGDDQETE